MVPESTVHQVKVVVIGTGASGLMCAHQLLQKKDLFRPDDVLILEARDRVGGRIHSTLESRKIPSHDGKDQTAEFYMDHGAAWVHGTGGDWPFLRPENSAVNGDMLEKNPMMDLLKQTTPSGENVCLAQLNPIFEKGNPWMNPNKVLIQPKELVLFIAGTQVGSYASKPPFPTTSKISDDEILSDALELHDKIMADVARIGFELVSNGQTMDTIRQSFQQALDTVLSDKTTQSPAEMDPFLPAVAGFYRHLISCWHATDASELQLYEFSALDPDDESEEADEQYVDEGDFYGPHCTMKNGMETVLQPLLELTRECIRLNESVVRIGQKPKLDTNDTVIRIETARGMIVEADCCVVTVSQGCLAEALRCQKSQGDEPDTTICFEADLSAEKTEAVENLCMGTYKKVFLTFDRIFWPPKEAFIGLGRSQDCSESAIDDLGDYLLLDNLWARHGIPCIEAVLIGKAGVWAKEKVDDVIRDSVLRFLSSAMGLDFESQLREWCIDCHITRWEEDPYSRGAYSGYRLGTLPKHTEGLATSEWEGRLVFAGEATVSGYEGSVYAALMSGKRAAEEVETCFDEAMKVPAVN